jgi:hypothetical protein
LPCSLFFVCSLPNEQKKEKKKGIGGHEPMARPRIERGIPAQAVKSTGNTPAGADHPPPSLAATLIWNMLGLFLRLELEAQKKRTVD